MNEEKYATRQGLEKEVIVYTTKQNRTLIATQSNMLLVLDPLTTHRTNDYQTPQLQSRGEFVYKMISDKELFSITPNDQSYSINRGDIAYIIKIPVWLMDWEGHPIDLEVVDVLKISKVEKRPYNQIRENQSIQNVVENTDPKSCLEHTI